MVIPAHAASNNIPNAQPITVARPALRLIVGTNHPGAALPDDVAPSEYECGEITGLPRGVHERIEANHATRFMVVNQHSILVFQMQLDKTIAGIAWRRDLATMLDYWDPA